MKTNVITIDEPTEQRKPFVWVTVIYAVVGAMVVLGFTPDPYLALAWFGVFFALILTNLFFLSKTVAVTLELMSHQGTEKGQYSSRHLYFYGGMKLVALAAILLLVWKSPSAPALAKMMGIGAIVAIPFFGGFWLNQRENTKEVPHAR